MRLWNPNTKSTGRPGDWTPARNEYFVTMFIRLWCWLCWHYSDASLFCLISFVGLQGRFPISAIIPHSEFNFFKIVGILNFVKNREFYEFLKFIKFVFSNYGCSCITYQWHLKFALQFPVAAVALSETATSLTLQQYWRIHGSQVADIWMTWLT